ncbi:MAG: hypothetical protein J1G02_03900 [Clostridiales bacterium]|nr:hypothetical protein [Clostridiales bacterium]
MKYLRVILTVLFAAVAATFISAPTKYMQSFFDGLTVWAYNVLPALFPFTVITTIALKLKPKSKHSLTKHLFGVSCDNVFITSVLCGYPIGARAISDSEADSATAMRMCSFCSTAGPIFMIATVGAKLLQNTTATVILVLVHFLSSIANGFLYRSKVSLNLIENDGEFTPEDFGNTITNSVLSIISVGGLIALFYMLSDMIKSFLPSNLCNSLVVSFAIGLLEMTNGVFGICKLTDVATATVLCSTLLALGGMCVFFQCYAFLGQKKIKAVDVIKMKLTQSAFATIFSFVLVKIFL